MSRVAGGDADALGELYDRYGRVVFGLIYRMLGSPESAEEVAQNAFHSVWRQASRYRPERGSVRTWLLAIARNAAIDWRRSKGNRTGRETAIDDTCARLRADGRRPYAMPIGGASVTGALGYVAAADELVGQLPDVDLVVTADGSGGTHAGLVAGLGDHERVLGVDVGTRPDLAERVPEKAAEIAASAGRPEPTGRLQLDRDRIGAGYGTKLAIATAQSESIIAPLLTVTGSVLARRLPGGRGTDAHWDFSTPELVNAYADWIAGPRGE